MRLSLRNKLILAFLIPTLTLIMGAGWLAHRAAQRGLEAELGRSLASVALLVASGFDDPRVAGRLSRLDDDPDSLVRKRFKEQLEAARAATSARRVFIVTPQMLSSVDTDPTVEPGTHQFALEADGLEIGRILEALAPSAHSVLFSDLEGRRYMNGYAPIFLDGEPVAVLGVEGSAAFFSTLEQFRTALVILGFIIGVMVLLVAIFFSHRLTVPISALVDAIRRYGRGELKEPVAVGSRDEIGFLAETFNDMRERLDRRDEQMQLMLSGIAHEVRNPLAGMELFCNLLSDELVDEPQRLELVEKVTRELEYLSRVVQDFLSFARRRPLTPERFQCMPLLVEVTEGVASLLSKHQVSLETHAEDSLELTGEREALRGLLTNLTMNAIQACSAGGKVLISASAKGEQRIIEIGDTGCGIPSDQLEKVFEPFFTTRQKGTGLGLALVNKTIQEHGGKIEVHSELGKGSTFCLSWPFDTALRPRGNDIHQPGSFGEVEMIG